MLWSINQFTERMSRDKRRRADVSLIIKGLQDGPTPWPPEYHPSPYVVEDTNIGFDSEGNYHCPSLRVEHVGAAGTSFEVQVEPMPIIERPVQLDGLWRLYE